MSTTAFGETTPRPFFAYWSPERAVLTHLLDQHPRRLTLQELAREVGHGFGETAVRRAVDNLSAACFLHREGAALIPAPAVVSFDQGPASTKF
jgi:hypothetical protein